MSRPLGAPVRFNDELSYTYDKGAVREVTALSHWWSREERNHERNESGDPRVVMASTLHLGEWDWEVPKAVYALDCALVQIEPEPRAEICEEIAEALLKEAARCRRKK